MSRGDRVEVIVDLGGSTRSFLVEADANGRRIEVKEGSRGERGMVLVELQARSDRVIKTDRFMAARVIAIIETKVEEPEEGRKPARARAGSDPAQEELTLGSD